MPDYTLNHEQPKMMTSEDLERREIRASIRRTTHQLSWALVFLACFVTTAVACLAFVIAKPTSYAYTAAFFWHLDDRPWLPCDRSLDVLR